MMDCLTLPSFQDGNGSDCADATGTRPNVTTNALSSAIKTRGWVIAARAHFPVNFTVSTPLLQMFATVAGKITKRPQPERSRPQLGPSSSRPSLRQAFAPAPSLLPDCNDSCC